MWRFIRSLSAFVEFFNNGITLHFSKLSYNRNSYLGKCCPGMSQFCSIQYDSMAVWEHIRPRPLVGCLPFWGELFLARYHMPGGGMCLLRKDKLLSFMFGRLLLACQRGLYLVQVLFSQQAGKIVMMMRLEIYQGCFPRAEEDMVETRFEFPALNLAAPIFFGYSTSCSQD